MHNGKKLKPIVDKIDEQLNRDRVISQEIMLFLESSINFQNHRELTHILSDHDLSESASFFELIYFPDFSDQIEMEPLLCPYTFNGKDEAHIKTFLIKKPRTGLLFFPDISQPLRIDIPENAINQYVTRLRIQKYISNTLKQSIDKNVDKPRTLSVLVELRNTRFSYTPGIENFLCSFFNKAGKSGRILDSCFTFLLQFLDEISPDTDIETALDLKRRKLVAQVEKIQQFQKKMQHNNIETLMATGVRFPYMNLEKSKNTIQTIDDINLLIFEKYPMEQMPYYGMVVNNVNQTN